MQSDVAEIVVKKGYVAIASILQDSIEKEGKGEEDDSSSKQHYIYTFVDTISCSLAPPPTFPV